MEGFLYKEIVSEYIVLLNKLGESNSFLVVVEEGLAFQNKIKDFENENFAIEQTKLFTRNLRSAVNAGYILSGIYFYHQSGRQINISHAFDTDKSQADFEALLKTA